MQSYPGCCLVRAVRFFPCLRVPLCLLIVAAPIKAEKPFDFASTPGKLPKQIAPTEYSIRIVPNIEKRTFTGNETVKLKADAPFHQLVLNALELEIAAAVVDDQVLPKSAIKIDKKQELLTLTLPADLPAGEHAVGFTFSGKINQQGQGLFYATYQEQGTGKTKTLLGTQFEAADARRFFPCWDEPSFRAKFQLTVVVPENWLAVSNMPVEYEAKGNQGREVRFAMTPSMSSYLNVFVAGELDAIETDAGGVHIRVVATKGKAEWGRYALESTAKILEYYNEYFGVPYPLPKLDQIALPGGFGGAMENWGGITYFESGLLFDPEKSSDQTRQQIFAVIAHEMAHMWFGDLVTMAWWDNLWLNEGFASWMGTKCTAHFNPQWEVWLRKDEPRNPMRHVGIPKERAMDGDARSTTHPIQQPVATEAEANSAFDEITYLKGQSFLRMLESFLGEDVFRDGIRHYIAAHKYSNSTTADLWAGLSEASGKPVNEIASGWTEQPGFPVVKLRRDDGDRIALFQERFTINYKNPLPMEWKIPLTYLTLGQPPQSRLMTDASDQLENISADRPLKLNVDGAGNYRVQYDSRTWDSLVASLSELTLPDRVNLLGDIWAMVQADRVPFATFFGFVDKLPHSTELAQWDQLANIINSIDRLLIHEPAREEFQEYARSVVRPVFDILGWDPKEGEASDMSTLRGSLIASLGMLGDPEIISTCRERFQKYLTDPKSLSPDLRRATFAVVARDADDSTWAKLHELGLNTTNIEEKQNYYDALAHARAPKLVQKTLAIAVSNELPSSAAAFLPGKVARASEHPELAWTFAKANMKSLLGKVDATSINSYAPSFFMFFSEPARIGELKAYAKANLSTSSSKDVAKAVDEIEFRSEFKKRLSSQFATWIENRRPAN